MAPPYTACPHTFGIAPSKHRLLSYFDYLLSHLPGPFSLSSGQLQFVSFSMASIYTETHAKEKQIVATPLQSPYQDLPIKIMTCIGCLSSLIFIFV